MRGRRILFILMLLVGIVILGAAGFLYLSGSRGAEEATTAETGSETQPNIPAIIQDSQLFADQPEPDAEFIQVVVSWQTVPRGWQMTEAELTLDTRLRADVGPDVFTDTAEVIGMYARTDIYQGETLTRDALVADPRLVGQEAYGPSSLIPPGWIAATVPMDRLNSVAYGLAPGDTVDIMMTFAFNKVDQQFQTLLQNSATFILETPNEDGEMQRTVIVVDPFGRFEQLPTGDIALVLPGETQRPLAVSMILQNARVIQVGPWTEPEPVTVPTPIPEGAPTPVPDTAPTPTPAPPDVLVVALPPQQQLFLSYAVDNSANIDFALRGPGDGHLYNVQNVDLNYLLQRFNIEVPADFEYIISPNVEPTPVAPTQNQPAAPESGS
jgi:Flp pilus assembly protein CpaB